MIIPVRVSLDANYKSMKINVNKDYVLFLVE